MIKNLNDMVELITKLDTNTKVLEGYNTAILGYVIDKKETSIAYSVNHILNILMERDKMTYLEAQEFFYYNIECMKKGDKGNPIFIYSNNLDL